MFCFLRSKLVPWLHLLRRTKPDRRSTPRGGLRVPVRVYAGSEILEGTLENANQSGARIRLATPLWPDQSVEILSLSGLKWQGVCRWSMPQSDGWLVGLEFNPGDERLEAQQLQ